MEIGATFDSWDDFSVLLKSFCDEEKVQLNVFSSKKVETANKRLAENAVPHPLKHKYKYARLACIHYGKGRSRCRGIRIHQSTFRKECPYTVFVTSDRKLGKLRIAEMCMIHNHEVGEDIYKMYPSQRRLSRQEEMNARSLIELKINKQTLREHLQRVTGKQLTMKDVHNLKAKFLANERDCTALFFKAIDDIKVSDPEAVVNITPKDDGTLDAVYVQSSVMVDNYNRYPEVLLCDSKYCVNSMNAPFFVMSVRDGLGTILPAAYILIPDKAEATLADALVVFAACNKSMPDTKTVVIDRDASEIPTIQDIIPDIKILITSSHTLKGIRQRVSSKVPEENRTAVYQCVSGMVNALSEEDYQLFYDKMKSISGYHFIDFFDSNWNLYRESWSKFWVDQHGKYCSKKMEPHSEKLRNILSGKFRLHEVMKELIWYSKILQEAKTVSAFNQTMKKKVRGDPVGDDIVIVDSTLSDSFFIDDIPEFDPEPISRESKLPGVAFIIRQKDDCCYSVSEEGKEEFFVDVKLTDCTCTSTQNPCKHIVAIRKHKSLLPTKSPVKTPPVKVPVQPPSSPIKSVESSFEGSAVSRYQTCLKLGMEMAEIASANESNFMERIAVLKHLISSWNSGKRVSALILDDDNSMSDDSPALTAPSCSPTNTHIATSTQAQIYIPVSSVAAESGDQPKLLRAIQAPIPSTSTQQTATSQKSQSLLPPKALPGNPCSAHQIESKLTNHRPLPLLPKPVLQGNVVYQVLPTQTVAQAGTLPQSAVQGNIVTSSVALPPQTVFIKTENLLPQQIVVQKELSQSVSDSAVCQKQCLPTPATSEQKQSLPRQHTTVLKQPGPQPTLIQKVLISETSRTPVKHKLALLNTSGQSSPKRPHIEKV